MSTGRVLQLTTRLAGSTVVAVAGVGATTVFLDSVQSFNTNGLGGFVFLGSDLYGYTTVDTAARSIKLASPLTTGVVIGTDANIFPASPQRWALVIQDSSEPTDAVWVAVPHALSGWFAPDGLRNNPEDREQIEFELSGSGMVITDVLFKEVWIDPEAIPDNAITETKITPGAITTPLLAANAVAAENIQAGAVVATKISGDAIDGKTVTGAVIRTAATGKRVQIDSGGMRQYDASEAVLVDIGGAQNKFKGSLEAEDLIVQDRLALFGLNNAFSMGSKVTLLSGLQPPSSAPTFTQSYLQETDPFTGRDVSGYVMRGWTRDETAGKMNALGVLGANGVRLFSNTGYYQWTTAFPGSWQWVQAYTNVRAENGDRVGVVIGTQVLAPAYTYKSRTVLVDDGALAADGSVVPGIATVEDLGLGVPANKEFYYGDSVTSPSTYASHAIGPTFRDGTEHGYVQVMRTTTGTIQYRLVRVLTKTTATFGAWVQVATGRSTSEQLYGASYGTQSRLGFPAGEAGKTFLVSHSSVGNQVWEINTTTGAGTRRADLDWVIVAATNSRAGHRVDHASRNLTSYNLISSANNVDRYSSAHWAGEETYNWYVTYAWRGHSTSNPTGRTTESPVAVVPVRKRAYYNITVAALPAPSAGPGQPRDVTKDAYGWVYYIGKGLADPTRTGRWLQTVQPEPSTNPSTVTSIDLTTYPVFTGTNPVAAITGFTAGANARVESTKQTSGEADFWVDAQGNGRWLDIEAQPTFQAFATAQSIPDNIATKVTGYNNNAANNFSYAAGTWTVPREGYYNIKSLWSFGAAGGAYTVYSTIRVNGTTVRAEMEVTKTGDFMTFRADWEGNLAAGDTIEFQVFQNSGAALNLNVGSHYNWVCARRLSTQWV